MGNRMCQIFRQKFLGLKSNEKLIPSEVAEMIRNCGVIITPKVDELLVKFEKIKRSEENNDQIKIRAKMNEILTELMMHEFKLITDTIITLSCSEKDAEKLKKKKQEIILQYINTHVNKKTIEAAIRQSNAKVVDDLVIFNVINTYLTTLASEQSLFKNIENILDSFPIWVEYLKYVEGIGPQMGGLIICRFNIHKANSVSAFWKFSGNDCVNSGEARTMRKEHHVERTYIDKDGNEKTGLFCSFDPWLKSKIGFVLGSNLIKQNKIYKKIYDDYKIRLQNDPNRKVGEKIVIDSEGKEKRVKINTPGHFHNMARRYMVKMFLQDLWLNWRRIEGLEIKPPYCEKYGLTPHYRTVDLSTGKMVEM